MADVNATQMRDALAWATNEPQAKHEASSNPFVWFWEAVEGDFNEDRTTAQILVDAGISMIPLVDQVCDVRDLIANCKKITKDWKDRWAWVALVLTLIGLFPTLGSLVKGVLKIFFGFVRNAGDAAGISKAVDGGMTWVVTFLRRREVQAFLSSKKIDEVFHWLAEEIRKVDGKITVSTLNAAFDRGIAVLTTLADRVSVVPLMGNKAKQVLDQVKKVRTLADKHLGEAIQPAHDTIKAVILRLEREMLEKQKGIVDTVNIHYRGVIPESTAVALIRKHNPNYLSNTGDRFIAEASLKRYRPIVDEKAALFDRNGKPRQASERFPYLSNQSIRSFHELVPHAIKGPARLYRILSPGSRGMSDCWVSKEVFDRLQSSPNPREAWRRYLAVWPDWNLNGQFVIYDVRAGETLNTWKGIASSQTKPSLAGRHLEGGWEQIVFNLERSDPRNDTIMYFKKNGRANNTLSEGLTQSEVDALTASLEPEKKAIFFEEHVAVRASINHPNISGPFDTGWGYTELEGAGLSGKIGLPALPGQLTTIHR